MACELCVEWANGRNPLDYQERHCCHCNQLMDFHDWSAHPHQLFYNRGAPEDCPGYTEVLDESFED